MKMALKTIAYTQKGKEKVEYLNRKLKVHEQMYDYMNDSTIVMVYEG